MKLYFSLTIFLLSLFVFNANAQTGLNFQGVARNANNTILASQPISIKLTILQGNSTGFLPEYTETRIVTTNAQGLFNVVIGDAGAISTSGNYSTINWRLSPKFLKIEIDPSAGSDFITMGTTQFQYVAYAHYAKGVDAENIKGVVPVTLGGTGVASLSELKSSLIIDKINNTSDIDKPISSFTKAALDLKLNKLDTSFLLQKVDTISLSRRINQRELLSNKSTDITLGGTNASDTLYPTQKAVKEYVAANTTVGGIADGGITTPKIADNAVTDAKINTVSGSKVIGNITGNAESATTATTATTAITAGTASTATKLATARNINGVAFDGTEDINISTVADAGTLTGTALNATVTESSLTSVGTLANLKVTNPIDGNITGNANTANYAVTANTAIAAGTAKIATKLGTARKINDIEFDGTSDINISADAESLNGTTLKSTITGSSLTSVGELTNLKVTNPIDGNITGNAATATTAANATTAVTATTAITAGTASTAIKLATPRKINDIDFDGSSDIAIPVKFTKDIKVNLGDGKTFGKYASGVTIPSTGKTLDEVLTDIVTVQVPPVYIKPTVTIGSSKSGSFEIGSNIVNINLSNYYIKNDGGDVTSTTYYKGGSALGSNTDNISSLINPVTYSVIVNYAAGPIRDDNLGKPYPVGQILAGSATSNTITITPFANKYYGSIATNDPTDAELRAATNENASAKSKSSFTISVSGGSKYIFYAYPTTLGPLSSIYAGGLESIGAFTLTTRNVTNASGYTQSYNIYTSNNSTSSSVSNIIIN